MWPKVIKQLGQKVGFLYVLKFKTAKNVQQGGSGSGFVCVNQAFGKNMYRCGTFLRCKPKTFR